MSGCFSFMMLLLSVQGAYTQQGVRSILQTFDIQTGERQVILIENRHFEAPNWSLDGRFFIINQDGSLFKVWQDGAKEKIYTGDATRCNNDHLISPDGNTIALSHNIYDGEDGWLTSTIFTVPISGGEPVRVTKNVPSFLHGWSPDGKMLAYTARRNNQFDIYVIPSEGGTEIQLTNTKGLSDGPEYSVDGKFIYYNAMDSGKMELWRMDSDGKHTIQLTGDAYSNWFPHVSPTGRHVVYISYLQDVGSAHPPMKKVALRLYDLETKKIKTLYSFIGGQGSLNVPSWSPDGKKFAFVEYVDLKNDGSKD
ncbi:TolB family protein [Maribacter antarcticus]|uniref:TolB family protein n=1 Tax=Maribacter antarcticus TaxID=505250 RepID=UPI00047D137C|nr:PD40 domain-containing protein [Maribacter antarcticus]